MIFTIRRRQRTVKKEEVNAACLIEKNRERGFLSNQNLPTEDINNMAACQVVK
jgi:hypothetical protein